MQSSCVILLAVDDGFDSVDRIVESADNSFRQRSALPSEELFLVDGHRNNG